MIHLNELKNKEHYWYVFEHDLRSQTASLEKVEISISGDDYTMYILKNNGNISFKTLKTQLDCDEFNICTNLFPIDKKEEAEIYWVKMFLREFDETTGVRFENFITIYKKLREDYPEWII